MAENIEDSFDVILAETGGNFDQAKWLYEQRKSEMSIEPPAGVSPPTQSIAPPGGGTVVNVNPPQREVELSASGAGFQDAGKYLTHVAESSESPMDFVQNLFLPIGRPRKLDKPYIPEPPPEGSTAGGVWETFGPEGSLYKYPLVKGPDDVDIAEAQEKLALQGKRPGGLPEKKWRPGPTAADVTIPRKEYSPAKAPGKAKAPKRGWKYKEDVDRSEVQTQADVQTQIPEEIRDQVGAEVIEEALRTGDSWWRVVARNAFDDPSNQTTDPITGKPRKVLSLDRLEAIVLGQINKAETTGEERRYRRGLTERREARTEERDDRAIYEWTAEFNRKQENDEERRKDKQNRRLYKGIMSKARKNADSTELAKVIRAIRGDSQVQAFKRTMSAATFYADDKWRDDLENMNEGLLSAGDDPDEREAVRKKFLQTYLNKRNLVAATIMEGQNALPENMRKRGFDAAHLAAQMTAYSILESFTQNPEIHALLISQGLPEGKSEQIKWIVRTVLELPLLGVPPIPGQYKKPKSKKKFKLPR